VAGREPEVSVEPEEQADEPELAVLPRLGPVGVAVPVSVGVAVPVSVGVAVPVGVAASAGPVDVQAAAAGSLAG